MADIRRLLDIAASVSVIVAASGVMWSLTRDRVRVVSTANALVQGGDSGGVEDVQAGLGLDLASRGYTQLGRTEARLAIVEFSDFECPFCKSYAQNAFPAIKKQFIETGELRYVFMNFPLSSIHPVAVTAATMAICAGDQGRFWEMRERLFSLPTLNGLAAPTQVAEGMTLNTTAFSECLATAGARVQTEMEEGRRLGVTSTPTFFLGEVRDGTTLRFMKRILGARSVAVFGDALRLLRAGGET